MICEEMKGGSNAQVHSLNISENAPTLFLLEQIFKCFLSQPIQGLILFLFELLFIR